MSPVPHAAGLLRAEAWPDLVHALLGCRGKETEHIRHDSQQGCPAGLIPCCSSSVGLSQVWPFVPRRCYQP